MASSHLHLPVHDHDEISKPQSPLDVSVTSLTPTSTPITSVTPGSFGFPGELNPGELPKPLASRDMFFPLSLYSPPDPESALLETDPASLVPVSSPPTATTLEPPTVYENAIARVMRLDSFLTPSMKSTLSCMLSVLEMHLSPTEDGVRAGTHSLITSVASPEETPDHCIKDIVDTIENGLLVFAGLGGGSTKSVTDATSLGGDGPRSVNNTATRSRKRQKDDSNDNATKLKKTRRSEKVRRDCKARDPTCQICNTINDGDVAHIISYSAKDKKGIDFWKFVELFRGVKATAALKAVALAPNPESVDTMKNVWFLCKVCHDGFGRAKLAVIPDLAGITYPYDSDQTSSYTATIEFPRGNKVIQIARWKKDPRGRGSLDGLLEEGHVITLSTDNALGLPLPHPLLFQIHAIISRVIALKAAAGYPLFPGFDRSDYDDAGVPAFTDTKFVDWLDHHTEDADPADLPDRYDSCSTEPHIMRWFKLTPAFPVKRAFPSSHTSESDSDTETHHPAKRDHVEDSDRDEERPRKYTVVLSEVGQRMDEKRQLVNRRLNEPERWF